AAARPEAAARHQHALDLRHPSHAEHLIVVEIRLLDAAVPNRDLTIERGGESIDYGTFDLHLDAHWIYHGAGIDGDDDAVHARLAVSIDRCITDGGDEGAIGLVERNAAMDAQRQSRAPAGLARCRIQHGDELVRVRVHPEQAAAESVGVGGGG